MNEQICQNCEHYYHHYIRYKRGRYVPINDGHCVFPRVKNRTPKTPACENFSPCKSDT